MLMACVNDATFAVVAALWARHGLRLTDDVEFLFTVTPSLATYLLKKKMFLIHGSCAYIRQLICIISPIMIIGGKANVSSWPLSVL
jgi:hypothetical protein